VRREAECCEFLRFEISEEADAVRLRISAPPVASAAVEMIFAPYLAGTDVAAECGAAAVGNGEQTLVSLNSKVHGGDRLDANGTGALTDRRSLTSTGALTSAGVAVACGVCCVLPFALPAVAMTWFGGVFATLAGMYRWAGVVAIGMIAAGWLLVWWRSMRTRGAPAGSTMRTMMLATLIGGVAVGWPLVERSVIAWLQP
jgi:hypothetical protein